MLLNIKKKLLQVKNNASIFQVPLANLSENPENTVGTSIISNFQNNWALIHDVNIDNASNANGLTQCIANISKNVENQKHSLEEISAILDTSKLFKDINKCVLIVDDIKLLCNKVEDKLISLHNVIEEVEFERLKQQHYNNLLQHDIKKRRVLVEFKECLHKDYIKKIEDYNTSKSKVLENRQKSFQEAFANDLETYKTMGTIPKLLERPGPSSALLEEIQLEYDQNELDNFLDNK